MESIETWGDFEVHLDEVLGRGGMGTVYKARQISLDRWVAVKVLETARASDMKLVQGFLDKFRQEARALAKIPDPRIVTALQAGENDGRYWFAMELIEGRTLEERLKEGAVAEAELRRISTEVARALDAAWRQGITHRDVKPANIFLCDDGGVKLGDFGLARGAGVTRTALTDGSALFCTPDYASPEQVEGREGDFRSDMYSLGCVLYEMATEQPPFHGDSPMEVLYKQSTAPPMDPRLLNPEISEGLEAVILRCLQKDPADRYETYGDLVRDLRPAPVVPVATTGSVPREFFWPAMAAAGAALFGIVVAAVFMVRPAEPVRSLAASIEPVPESPRVRPAPVVPPEEPAPLPTPAPSPEPGLLEWLTSRRLTAEELEELDGFFEEGTWPLLSFPAQVALAERSDHDPVGPVAILERLEAEPELGLLLPGSIRRACGEIVAAMEFGEVRPDLELPEWAEALAPNALAAMRRERAAMEATEEAVLERYPDTWAWRRRVRAIHEEFRMSSFVALPETGWAFTRVPRDQESSSWKDGVLHDPVLSSTIARTVKHRGWRVEFSFSPAKASDDPAFFVIPGKIPKSGRYDLVRFRPGSCAVVRRGEAGVTVVSEVEITEADRHELAFVTRGPHRLVYCDGKLVQSSRTELVPAIRLSVQQGAARIHRVEVVPVR